MNIRSIQVSILSIALVWTAQTAADNHIGDTSHDIQIQLFEPIAVDRATLLKKILSAARLLIDQDGSSRPTLLFGYSISEIESVLEDVLTEAQEGNVRLAIVVASGEANYLGIGIRSPADMNSAQSIQTVTEGLIQTVNEEGGMLALTRPLRDTVNIPLREKFVATSDLWVMEAAASPSPDPFATQ